MQLECTNIKCKKKFEVYKTTTVIEDGHVVIKERCGECGSYLKDITPKKGLCANFKQKEGSASDYKGY